MKVVLEAVVGSHAYGMNGPDSDIDTAGVFVVPTETILGLFPYKESIVKNDGIDKTEDPDTSYHEVKKFINLVASGNPTVTEMLWLDNYSVLSPEMKLLVEGREELLSQNVRDRYLGYALGQFKRFSATGDFGSDLKKRQHKNARHIRRLVIQAEGILTTGKLQVRLTPEQKAKCFEFAHALINFPEETTESMFREIERVRSLPTDLQEKPNLQFANDILLLIRSVS